MAEYKKITRRQFLKQSTTTAAVLTAGIGPKLAYAGGRKKRCGKKVIVLGIDGMDPVLSEKMMKAGQLPNFSKLAELGGYRRLGTSNPALSPVAWANFITGAGPGSHGIFDFVRRDPQNPTMLISSVSETVSTKLKLKIGNHKVQFAFWPFNQTSQKTLLSRQGIPFWEYLDEAGVNSYIYMVPSNYPPSKSKYGHHHSVSGLGTPDLLGSKGLYQVFSETGPFDPKIKNGGRYARIIFENHTAHAKLIGPLNNIVKKSKFVTADFEVHRDIKSDAAAIEINGHKILLKEKQWSDWTTINYKMDLGALTPDKQISGICRFYLQEISPTFRLYVTPININPFEPAARISEPKTFSKEISKKLGHFYTTGFQEDYMARIYDVFTDEEFKEQAQFVLDQRIAMLDYALDYYDDGVLFFYFSSTDLQSHIFWWDTPDKHPTRLPNQATKYHNSIKELYKKMDKILGQVLNRYGDDGLVLALSDHGFSHLKGLFSLNTWLRDNGYINPPYCTSDMKAFNWSKTRAYGLGLNSLYLNLKGRERNGIVEPIYERKALLSELTSKLESVRDVNGNRIIHKVYRSDKIFSGSAMELAPDLIIGYSKGWRCSFGSGEGKICGKVIMDNKIAWCADHCFLPEKIPGVLFSNRRITVNQPSLVDLAPTILAEFGLSRPDSMIGRNVFAT